jgi:uncharacterized membrane protein required for colicin V production
VDSIQPFDLALFLGLFAMFILGYAQGIIRRLLGLVAILFSFVVAGQLSTPLGGYLAEQWTNASPAYSYMVAFAAVFVAGAGALTLGIQLSYRPAPLLNRYPVLDEVLGGVIAVIEGLIIFMAVLIITDPYFATAATAASGPGEVGVFRGLHGFIDDALSAQVLREHVIPGVLSVFGFLFPKDVVDTFVSVLTRL